MASNVLLGIIAVIIIAAVVYVAAGGMLSAGRHTVAVQITDPPNVPSGTQALLVTYSSVQLHVVSPANESGWISTTGSGTINLVALTNTSQTIASASLASNSTVNLVRFNITSAKIVINGSTYNVSSPNDQVTASINGGERINSSAAVLVDFTPTVNAHANAGAESYMLVPAAQALVINSNSSISINTAIGSIANITADIKARLGLGSQGGICIGVGGGPCGGSGGGGIESLTIVGSGQRVSNFVMENANYSSQTVSGFVYAQYPVATAIGANLTIGINGTVGYACDNTEFRLVTVYSNGTAAFAHMSSNATYGGCPI